MSNTIGFSHFRRFAHFPEIDLGNITILVGGNNSGKSTLVKALLLCIDNMRLMTAGTKENAFVSMSPKFRFDANEWHDVKIKTFSRAIHNKPTRSLDLLDDELSLPTEMRFVFTLGTFKFVIQVAGDRDKDEVTGDVTSLSIEDRENMVKFDVDYRGRVMQYSVLGSTTERETLAKRLYNDYVSAKASLEKLSDAGQDLSVISSQSEKVTSLEKRIAEIVNPDGDELPDDFDYASALKKRFLDFVRQRYTYTTWDLPFEDYGDIINENLFVHIIGNFIGFANNPGKVRPTGIADPEEEAAAVQEWMYVQEARSVLHEEVDKIRKSQDDLRRLISNICVEYITAHAANQNTIYNTADRNDYIAQTVHEFMRAKISKGQKEYTFVTDWMQKFEVGSDFEIISIDGEAYRVKIKDEDNTSVNLADKGMGSIQLMILLLRLATILRNYQPRNIVTLEDNDALRYPAIIIEEPEQNLHPKVQSKLADLFLYLNQEYHCRFLIETHSEYIIRKTQVDVAEKKYVNAQELNDNNPFKVYYFPSDDTKPYEMVYRTDGCFENDFGEGFFDEAEKLAFKIL